MLNRNLKLAILLALLTLAAHAHAAPAPAKFPMVFTKDGVTVNITGAEWAKGPDGAKGLIVHYNVAGNSTVPYPVGYANCNVDSRGAPYPWDNANMKSGDGWFFTTYAYPDMAHVSIQFTVSDPKAPRAFQDFTLGQSAFWDVAVPPQAGGETDVNESQPFEGGTVTLSKIQRTADSKDDPKQTIVDLTFQAQGCSVRSPAEKAFDQLSITPMSIGTEAKYRFQHINYPSLNEKFDSSASKSNFRLWVPLNGSMLWVILFPSPHFNPKGPDTSRAVTIDLPLTGLAGEHGIGPEASLGHAKQGELDATLESLTRMPDGKWSAVLWLKSLNPASEIDIASADIETESGFALHPAYTYSADSTNRWRANGDLAAPADRRFDITFTMPAPLPATMKSVTVKVKPAYQVQFMRRFKFTGISAASLSRGVIVNRVAPELPVAGSSPLWRSAKPATMTLLSLTTESEPDYDNGGKPVKKLRIDYHIANIPYTPLIRGVDPTLTDEHAHAIETGSSTDTRGDDPTSGYITVNLPEPGVKKLNFDITVTDSMFQYSTPLLTFPKIPLPKAPLGAPMPQ